MRGTTTGARPCRRRPSCLFAFCFLTSPTFFSRAKQFCFPLSRFFFFLRPPLLALFPFRPNLHGPRARGCSDARPVPDSLLSRTQRQALRRGQAIRHGHQRRRRRRQQPALDAAARPDGVGAALAIGARPRQDGLHPAAAVVDAALGDLRDGRHQDHGAQRGVCSAEPAQGLRAVLLPGKEEARIGDDDAFRRRRLMMKNRRKKKTRPRPRARPLTIRLFSHRPLSLPPHPTRPHSPQDTEELAHKIVQASGNGVELGEINWA